VGSRYSAGRRRQGRPALNGWAPAIVTGGGSLNLIRIQIQTDSNQLQIVLNFDLSKKDFLDL
jgi:hypothetical protein